MPDVLDTQLLHALQIDGRAPFSLIAEVLGVSDQTIARRYHRLRSAGLLHVRGLADPDRLGQTQWIIRVQCIPNAATAVAEALARRPDTSWIGLASGGTEIICSVRVLPGERGNQLLLETLPRSRNVVAMTAHCVLHTFFGGALSLINKSGALTPEQVDRLRLPAPDGPAGPATVDAADRQLLAVLEEDGRTTVSELASATGWSQTTVRRRVAQLRASGTLYFDVDFNQELLDMPARAVLWLTVGPSQLATVGQALAGHPETGFVAATTGTMNIYAGVLCSSAQALYAYLTTQAASLPAVQHIETVPVIRTVKQSGLLAPAGSA